MDEPMTAEEKLAKLEEVFPDVLLDPELAEHVYPARLSQSIHHPLVVCYPYWPTMNNHMNQMLAQKKVALAEAVAKSDYHSVVFLHERPFRLNALAEHWDGMTLDQRHRLIRWVWSDSENIDENLDEWRDLWSEIDPLFGRSVDEKQFYDDLPETLTIYRGAAHQDADAGMSWTLDRERAIWFARRFANHGDDRTPYLATGLINKTAIRACILGRNEKEVVVMPEDVQRPVVLRLKKRSV